MTLGRANHYADKRPAKHRLLVTAALQKFRLVPTQQRRDKYAGRRKVHTLE